MTAPPPAPRQTAVTTSEGRAEMRARTKAQIFKYVMPYAHLEFDEVERLLDDADERERLAAEVVALRARVAAVEGERDVARAASSGLWIGLHVCHKNGHGFFPQPGTGVIRHEPTPCPLCERDEARSQLAAVTAERDRAVEIATLCEIFGRASQIAKELSGNDVETLLAQLAGKPTLKEQNESLKADLAALRGRAEEAERIARRLNGALFDLHDAAAEAWPKRPCVLMAGRALDDEAAAIRALDEVKP